MASIEKRGDSYKITVFLGRDGTGKKIQKSTTYTPEAFTKNNRKRSQKVIEKDVESYAAEFEKKARNEEILDGEKITFDTYLEKWKTDWAEAKLTPRVYEDYLWWFEKRISPALGHMKISRIKPSHIQKIITDMQKEGYAPKTIKSCYTAMNSVFKMAFRLDVIPSNPCNREKIELPKIKTVTLSPDQYFTQDQAKRFLNYLYSGEYKKQYKSHIRILKSTGEEYKVPEYTETRKIHLQYQVLFTIAIYGDLRRSELLALRWSDFDFQKRTISVSKAISRTRSNSSQFEKDPKTEAGYRTFRLPPSTFFILKRWRSEQEDLADDLGSKWKGYRGEEFDNNYVFIRLDTGEGMNLDTPYHKFKELVTSYNATCENEKDKLPLIRFHDLRHTTATLLLGSGIDIETVAKRLGHENASVTLDIYGHALESMDEVAAEKLEAMFAVNN